MSLEVRRRVAHLVEIPGRQRAENGTHADVDGVDESAGN